jgi:hypothetical protein
MVVGTAAAVALVGKRRPVAVSFRPPLPPPIVLAVASARPLYRLVRPPDDTDLSIPIPRRPRARGTNFQTARDWLALFARRRIAFAVPSGFRVTFAPFRGFLYAGTVAFACVAVVGMGRRNR